MRDKLVIALGNFMHSDLSLKKCFLALADAVGMGIVITLLGLCILA